MAGDRRLCSLVGFLSFERGSRSFFFFFKSLPPPARRRMPFFPHQPSPQIVLPTRDREILLPATMIFPPFPQSSFEKAPVTDMALAEGLPSDQFDGFFLLRAVPRESTRPKV